MNLKKIWNQFGDQLGGTILHPQYFIKLAERQTVAQSKKRAKGTFLDIGCGRQWYRGELESQVDKYFGLDHPKISKQYQSHYPIELLADATKIPLNQNAVDFAMMIMVLEHLPDPEKALQEINRVLKRSGQLIICTVENYPGHDLPYNYYHWTKYGLKEILKRNGFKIERLESFGNFWETQVVMQNVFLMHYIKSLASQKAELPLGILLLLLLAPLMILGNIFALGLGRRAKTEEYALAHLVVASKKTSR